MISKPRKCGESINSSVKNIKQSHAVLNYKLLSSKKNLFVNGQAKLLKKALLDSKNSINYKVLEARILKKIQNLSPANIKKSRVLLNRVFITLTLKEKDGAQKYFEFTKELAKEINRKEGREVFDILINLSKKYM